MSCPYLASSSADIAQCSASVEVKLAPLCAAHTSCVPRDDARSPRAASAVTVARSRELGVPRFTLVWLKLADAHVAVRKVPNDISDST